MPEGLSPVEVSDHLHHAAEHEPPPSGRRSRAVQIAEATLLALVTIATAWAGYAAAKWSTESRVDLARSSSQRSMANRANLQALTLRDFDSLAFNAWFATFLLGNATGEQVAIRRFRPAFKVAFDAWWATDPLHSATAPPGPTYMPQYHQPDLVRATALDRQADSAFAAGGHAGSVADEYVRITVLLAAVLFLVGIGTTFRLESVRYGLIGVGGVLFLTAVVLIAQQPRPPR